MCNVLCVKIDCMIVRFAVMSHFLPPTLVLVSLHGFYFFLVIDLNYFYFCILEFLESCITAAHYYENNSNYMELEFV